MGESRERTITIRLPEDIYSKLIEISRSEGYSNVSEYIKAVVLREIESYKTRIDLIEERIREIEESVRGLKQVDVSKLEHRIMRKIQDLINPFTARVNELAMRIAEIIERVEGMEAKFKEFEQRLQGIQEAAVRTAPARRRTGLQRLKEQGVLFEGELKRIRDRDSFFAYLERGGAKIIVTSSERIAVDRGFWERFKDKIFVQLTTNIDDEIKSRLDPLEYKLFTKLKEDGLIYFDSVERRWKPVVRGLLD